MADMLAAEQEAAMQWVLAVFLTMMPVMVTAQGIPADLAARVEGDPQKYMDDLAVMIAGFGQNGAIDGPGLRNVVAMARADARAMAMRRLQGADLDADGAIAGDEMRVKAAASAALARGRLVLYFGKADLDGDDHVSADELHAYANLVAQQIYSEDKVAAVYAILGFDGNGDGRVTLAEVETAIAFAGSGATNRKIKQKLKV